MYMLVNSCFRQEGYTASPWRIRNVVAASILFAAKPWAAHIVRCAWPGIIITRVVPAESLEWAREYLHLTKTNPDYLCDKRLKDQGLCTDVEAATLLLNRHRGDVYESDLY